MNILKAATTLSLLAFGPVAGADSLFPSPSIPSIADRDGWAIAIGIEAEYGAEYDGSDAYGLEAEPGLLVQKRSGNQVWFLEGAELGWRARVSDVWLVQAGLRLEGGREESEAPELTGLGDTDDEVAAMFEIRRGFGANWNNWAAARVMAGDSGLGSLLVLAGGHTFGANAAGTGIDLFAFATFADSNFLNRDFGVTGVQAARSGLAVTDLSGGYRSFGVNAIGRWMPGKRWQIVSEIGIEKYNSRISASPIALDDFEWEAGVSILYRFR